MLPPLSPAAYRDVITKPAAVYSRQVARLDLEPDDLEVDEIEECFLVVEWTLQS